jgi:hypothetical protein
MRIQLSLMAQLGAGSCAGLQEISQVQLVWEKAVVLLLLLPTISYSKLRSSAVDGRARFGGRALSLPIAPCPQA